MGKTGESVDICPWAFFSGNNARWPLVCLGAKQQWAAWASPIAHLFRTPSTSTTFSWELAYWAARLNEAPYHLDTTNTSLNIPAVRSLHSMLGMENISFHNEQPHSQWHTNHLVAHSIASKRLPNGENLVIVAIRGTVPSLPFDDGLWAALLDPLTVLPLTVEILVTPEWQSNFHLGFEPQAGLAQRHLGFNTAMADVRVNLTVHMRRYGILYELENTRILIAGHSRGGAVANLLAAELNREFEDMYPDSRVWIYAYTFAAPRVTTDAVVARNAMHNNIFNIINTEDRLTPNLPVWVDPLHHLFLPAIPWRFVDDHLVIFYRYGFNIGFTVPGIGSEPHDMRTHTDYARSRW